MKPYFDDGQCVIYHGDCREILPTLGTFDLLLTDPPYGIGEAAGKNKSRNHVVAATDYGDHGWDDAPPDTETISIVRASARQQIVFGGNYFSLPPSSCWLVWDKDNGASDFADCELAWTNLDRAVRRLKYRWAGMLQEPGRKREARKHPTQKPLDVISWAMGLARGNVESVVDPFMGSGTTLRAAKDRGIRAVGIDKVEAYCEIAAKRLSQQVLDFGETA